MKKIIIPFCMLALATAGKAQTTYFSTSFDDGIPAGFSLYDLDKNEPSNETAKLGFAVGTPWVGIKVDKEENGVAASTSWYKKAGTSNDWLVTPAVTVASAKAVVSWRAKASDKDYSDGYSVYISEKGAAPEDFDTTAPALKVKKESATWTEHSISLAGYEGKTVYIAFVNDTKDKALLYLDDLFIGIPSTVGLSLDLRRCYDGYGDITISGSAFATGTEDINGYTVGFSMGGKTVTYTSDATLKAGVKVPFTIAETVNIERYATEEYTAWIKSGADSSAITGRLSAYPWKLVAEEVTGTWCQYCVRGIGAMEYMKKNHPDGFIGIAIHNDGSALVPDSMAIPGEEYRQWVMSKFGISGYPKCVMSRNAMYAIDPGTIPTYYENIKNFEENYTGISLTAKLGDDGRISAHTYVFFANDYTGADFKLAYIVIENDVHRTHAETGIENDYCGYDQMNGYAGGSMGSCFGFEDLPSVVNADNIWYQDVARGYAGSDGYKGIGGMIPADINEGDSFAHDYSLDMPETVLKKENTELIVLLLDKNGIIRNAEKCAISSIDTSIKTVQNGAARHDGAYYTLTGQRVETPRPGTVYIVNGKKVMMK